MHMRALHRTKHDDDEDDDDSSDGGSDDLDDDPGPSHASRSHTDTFDSNPFIGWWNLPPPQ
jgi:hypothetical protein